MKIGIIGYGGFAREVSEYIKRSSKYGVLSVEYFVEDEFVTDGCKPISNITKHHQVLIAIGDGSVRDKIVKKLPDWIKYHTYIDDSAKCFTNRNIGAGSIICPNTIITTNVFIGKHVHLNLNTTVGHDTVIKDFVTTAPAVNVSGNCVIDERTYLGTNAAIREKITITNDVVIGLNSGVVNNIVESGVYVGTPAKRLK